MKIIIATRNSDKYKIIKKLLEKTIFQGSKFIAINELGYEIADKEEEGDVLNRAKTKAKTVFDQVPRTEYDLIIGIDDAIEMKNQLSTNIKDHIENIISDKYLNEKEIVNIVRAFSFIKNNGIEESIVTKIPFEYKKAKDQIKIKNNSYPLSYVLRPLKMNKVVSELSSDESNEYYQKYCEDDLKWVKEKLND